MSEGCLLGFGIAVIAVIVFGLCYASQMTQCPHCKSAVNKHATVCPHCNKSLAQ